MARSHAIKKPPQYTHREVFDYSRETDFDPLTLFFVEGFAMVKEARAARSKDAQSYRGLIVGAAIMANHTQLKKLANFYGHNHTPYKGAPKYCAEMRAEGRASSRGYTQLEAVVVAGPTDRKVIESVTHLSTPTLHPCEPCRGLLEDATVVLTVGGDEDILEAHTGAELKHKHRIGDFPKRKRQAAVAESRMSVAIDDPNFYGLTNARRTYDELSAGIDLSQIEYQEDLRMARAEAAVQAIRMIGESA